MLSDFVAFHSRTRARVADARRHLGSKGYTTCEHSGWLSGERVVGASSPLHRPPTAATAGPVPRTGALPHREPPGAVQLTIDDTALLAARSAAGQVPLWWWVDGEGACAGTRLTDVLALRSRHPLDEFAAAGLIAGQAVFPDSRSPVAGVRALDSGCALRLPLPGRGTPSVERWFDPWPEIGDLPAPRRRSSFNDLAARFGEAVRSSVERELSPDGGNLLSLSGGVDSSSLAFLAHSAGRPLAALSLVPDERDPLYGREMGFLEPLVSQVGIEPHWTRALTTENRLAWLESAPVAPLPVVHPVLCLLPQILESLDARVLVGGEFCDELCGGAFMLVDWARTARPHELALAIRHGIVRRRWAKAWLRYRVKGVPPIGPYRELPEVFAAEVQEEWEQWRMERHRALAESPKVHAYTIELLRSLDGAVAMNWEVCSSLGITRVWPFLSQEVMGVVASLRPHDMVVPIRKRLSRTAFRGVVPDRWLLRGDDGAFGKERTFEPVSFGPLPDELAGVFRPEIVAGEASVGDRASALAVAAALKLTRNLQPLRAQ